MDHQTITAERGRRADDLRAAATAMLEQQSIAAGVMLDLDDDTCVAAGPKSAILELLGGSSQPQAAAASPSDENWQERLTMDQVETIRSTITPGDGWDGDNWDYALANAVAAQLALQQAAPVAIPEVVRNALETIAAWDLPATGKTWESGNPVSYEAQYGSNGARSYMRQVASNALAAIAAAPAAPASLVAVEQVEPVSELTPEQIDRIWNAMPGGADGWLKQFGYQQFAHAIQLHVLARASAIIAGTVRPTDDELWDATLRDRDTYHEWADKLAKAISKHFDAYIGEHSNMNLPWAEALEAIEAAPPAASADAVVDARMAEIGKLIATQDNRITDQPIFIVQQRRRITGLDTGYCDNIIWMCSEDEYSEASQEEAAQLEAEYQGTGRERSGWTRTGYMDEWEFVTACLTEQGCKDYLARDGHNLKEPRIYAEGSYRNEEYRAVRNFLLSLALKSGVLRTGEGAGTVDAEMRVAAVQPPLFSADPTNVQF